MNRCVENKPFVYIILSACLSYMYFVFLLVMSKMEYFDVSYCWERTGCSLRDGVGATDFLCPEDDIRLTRAGVRW